MYAWTETTNPHASLFQNESYMQRVSETIILLRNNNCTTALSTARCYLEVTDDFPIFLSSGRLFLKITTEIKQEDIIQSLMTRKIVIFQEMSAMNVDYFRYLVLRVNFLNFRLCKIQLGAQCLLGEHGPLSLLKDLFVASQAWNSECNV